jgi:transcriptional regulator with XRE-family HTH domain
MCIDIMRKERGQALKSVRKAKGITQGQAAILSGVFASYRYPYGIGQSKLEY